MLSRSDSPPMMEPPRPRLTEPAMESACSIVGLHEKGMPFGSAG